MSNPAVVALGGGHGLAASLGALRKLTDRLTAVVTVADDGGSSGRLRRELGVLPPGDLRMALSALCSDSEWGNTWRDVLQHRFESEGELHQHSMGNLLIVALWELLGDPVIGLEWVGRLLQAEGRVLPMSSVPIHIEASVRMNDQDPAHETLVHGQSAVAHINGQVHAVRLVPSDAPACSQAIDAVMAADWIVLGPGSWFTSVMPHLLVPQLRQALCKTPAKRCITLNLVAEQETGGLTPAELLRALSQHAPEFKANVVLADPSVIQDRAALELSVQALDATLVVCSVTSAQPDGVHDPLRLAAAYRQVLR